MKENMIWTLSKNCKAEVTRSNQRLYVVFRVSVTLRSYVSPDCHAVEYSSVTSSDRTIDWHWRLPAVDMYDSAAVWLKRILDSCFSGRLIDSKFYSTLILRIPYREATQTAPNTIKRKRRTRVEVETERSVRSEHVEEHT